MRRNLKWLLALSTVALVGVAYVGNIQATPSSGFAATTISVGRLPEFDVTHHLVSDKTDDDNSKRSVWLSLQKTKGPSDRYVCFRRDTHLTRRLFGAMLQRIWALPVPAS